MQKAYRMRAGYQRFDHTVITLLESVGVIRRKRPAYIYLESTTYDWFGPGRTARNGFDSRWRYHSFIDLQVFCSPFAHTKSLVVNGLAVFNTGFKPVIRTQEKERMLRAQSIPR